MKPRAALAAFAALTVAVAATVAPAFAARSSYVIDDAHLLSPATVSKLNQQIGDFNAQTGKEVVVVTTDSLGGTDPNAALERSFAQQQVNGVEIFIAKNEKQIKIAGDRASRRFFPSGSFSTIYQAMRPYFAQGNFDQGVETGVSLVINTYLGHTSSLNRGRQPVGATSGGHVQRSSNSGGFSMGWIWWIIILAVIFFIIRGIFRAIAGPRMYGGGGGPGYGPGGPGYGPGPGYGGYGGGMGMGGGGFWSGLLGGLGGAWLGNEIFGGRRDYNAGDGGSWAGTGGVDPGTSADASGWQSDAGQIDTSSIGGGGWGDSSSGGGDSGGWGGGGDSGGGGGDSGGGW